MQQLSLFDFAKPEPGSCDHEAKVADIGAGKSYCVLMRCWTNCREAGHCLDDGKRHDFASDEEE